MEFRIDVMEGSNAQQVTLKICETCGSVVASNFVEKHDEWHTARDE